MKLVWVEARVCTRSGSLVRNNMRLRLIGKAIVIVHKRLFFLYKHFLVLERKSRRMCLALRRIIHFPFECSLWDCKWWVVWGQEKAVIFACLGPGHWGGGQAAVDPVTPAPALCCRLMLQAGLQKAALPARLSLTCPNPLNTKQISENSNPSIYQITLPLARKLAPKFEFEYNNLLTFQDVRCWRQWRDWPGGDDEDRAGHLRHAGGRGSEAHRHSRGEGEKHLYQVSEWSLHCTGGQAIFLGK